jgi:hypothetical protein
MRQVALANVFLSAIPPVQPLMQDGLGTLVNASVNALKKPAMIYKSGTQQFVLVLQSHVKM